MLRYFLGLFFVLVFHPVFSSTTDSVTLSGVAHEYANYSLVFNVYADRVTMTEREVGRCVTDSSGQFSLKITLRETQEVFCYLGIYKAFFYAEPGKNYSLLFPPRQDKSLADDVNPFFKHEAMTLGVMNVVSSELNILIIRFDELFDPFISLNFNYLYLYSDVQAVDSLKRVIENEFKDVNNVFFNNYKDYKLAFLYHLTY